MEISIAFEVSKFEFSICCVICVGVEHWGIFLSLSGLNSLISQKTLRCGFIPPVEV